MKESYEKPNICINRFEIIDIVTASGIPKDDNDVEWPFNI